MKSTSALLKRALDSFTNRMELWPDFCLPERRYATVGEIAHDCEQFTVSGTTIMAGPNGLPAQGFPTNPKSPVIPHFQIAFSIAREVPNLEDDGDAASGESIQAAGLQAAEDGRVLTELFYAAFSPQTNEIIDPCDNVYFGGVTWQGPQGDFLATTLTAYVQL